MRPGDRVVFGGDSSGGDFAAEIIGKSPEGEIILRFDREGEAFRDALARHGAMPLPPYIKRPRGGEARDRIDYQTMFARAEGAVAAPTAGLHFTPSLLDRLASRGLGWVTVTLHVGPGTFLPVKTDDPREHRMHAERGIVAAETALRINQRAGPAGASSPSARPVYASSKAPPPRMARSGRSTAKPGSSSCRDILSARSTLC